MYSPAIYCKYEEYKRKRKTTHNNNKVGRKFGERDRQNSRKSRCLKKRSDLHVYENGDDKERHKMKEILKSIDELKKLVLTIEDRPILYTREQAAEILQSAPSTITKLVDEGWLDGVKVNSRLLIKKESLEKFIKMGGTAQASS